MNIRTSSHKAKIHRTILVAIPIFSLTLFFCQDKNPVSSHEPATIFIASVPPVVSVAMDGEYLGRTNVEVLKVRSGAHAMRFEKNSVAFDTTMTFVAGNNPSVLVRIPSDH